MDIHLKPGKTRNHAPATPETGQSVFLKNILESSTEYSIIGKDLTGKIELWNAGARCIYGYEPQEVTGKANSSMLHTPEDIAEGKITDVNEGSIKVTGVPREKLIGADFSNYFTEPGATEARRHHDRQLFHALSAIFAACSASETPRLVASHHHGG